MYYLPWLIILQTVKGQNIHRWRRAPRSRCCGRYRRISVLRYGEKDIGWSWMLGRDIIVYLEQMVTGQPTCWMVGGTTIFSNFATGDWFVAGPASGICRSEVIETTMYTISYQTLGLPVPLITVTGPADCPTETEQGKFRMWPLPRFRITGKISITHHG